MCNLFLVFVSLQCLAVLMGVVYVFQSYFYNDDLFNFNYAQAKAAVGNFKEAEEVFCYAHLLIAAQERGVCVCVCMCVCACMYACVCECVCVHV